MVVKKNGRIVFEEFDLSYIQGSGNGGGGGLDSGVVEMILYGVFFFSFFKF